MRVMLGAHTVYRVIIAAALVAATASALRVHDGRAQQAAAVVAVGQQRAEGELVAVPVSVANVHNLGAFSFVLSYDSHVLSFERADVGDFMSSTGRRVVCRDPQDEDSAIRVSCVSLDQTPPGPDGAGELIVFRFRPKEHGASPLALSKVKLLHPDASPVVVSGTTDGRYVVASASSAVWKRWWFWAAIGAAALVAAAGGLGLSIRRLRGRRARDGQFADVQGP